MNEERAEFSVVQFFPDGTYEYVKRLVGAEEAVRTAKDYSTRPAVLLGVIERIIITDGGDCTVFEWKAGEGVTFPAKSTARDKEMINPSEKDIGRK
jgi:hypothetical protein